MVGVSDACSNVSFPFQQMTATKHVALNLGPRMLPSTWGHVLVERISLMQY